MQKIYKSSEIFVKNTIEYDPYRKGALSVEEELESNSRHKQRLKLLISISLILLAVLSAYLILQFNIVALVAIATLSAFGGCILLTSTIMSRQDDTIYMKNYNERINYYIDNNNTNDTCLIDNPDQLKYYCTHSNQPSRHPYNIAALIDASKRIDDIWISIILKSVLWPPKKEENSARYYRYPLSNNEEVKAYCEKIPVDLSERIEEIIRFIQTKNSQKDSKPIKAPQGDLANFINLIYTKDGGVEEKEMLAALTKTKSYFQPTRDLGVVERNEQSKTNSESTQQPPPAQGLWSGKPHQTETHEPTHEQKRRGL